MKLALNRNCLFCLFFLLASVSTQSVKAEPGNDDFTDAIELPTSSGVISGTNIDASGETDEIIHVLSNAAPLQSVWYKWTADSSSPMAFDTIGSNFDTVLAVYTGTSVNELTEIVSNDDYPGLQQSVVVFTPAIGTTYSIVVDSFADATGAIFLNWGPTFTANVSGTISLPAEFGTLPAPQNFDVSLGVNWNGSWYEKSIPCGTVTLPANSSSVQYNCSADNARGTVDFTVSALNIDGIFPWNYYNSTGTTGYSKNAQHITAEMTHTNIDFTLVKSAIITGSVTTGNCESFDTDQIFTIWSYYFPDNTSANSTSEYGYYFLLTAGESVFDYSLTIPDEGFIKISYEWDGSPKPNYLQQGYYSSSGTDPDLTTGDFLDPSTDHTNINLTLLNDQLKGDLNNDSTVTLADAIIGLQIITGMTITGDITLSADVNCDGKLGVAEVLSVLNKLQN